MQNIPLDDQHSFAGSKGIHYLFELADYRTSVGLITRLLVWGDVYDPSLVEYLTRDRRNFEIRALSVFMASYIEGPPPSLVARSMRRYLVARKVFELVPDPFSEVRQRPESLVKLMASGAIGLYSAANRQFRQLRTYQEKIANWLSKNDAKYVWLIDSPRGGTIPAQVLAMQLQSLNIRAVTKPLLAPRATNASARYSIREAVSKVFYSGDELPDYVVYVDDASSGTRFIKIYDELKRVFSARLIASVQTTNRNTASDPWQKNLPRLERRLKDQVPHGDDFSPIQIYSPIQPIQLDIGPAFILLDDEQFPWITGDPVIGFRKVAFVFEMALRYGEMARQLGASNQAVLRRLASLWGNSVDGKQYVFKLGLLESMMADLFSNFDLQEILDQAAINFPGDFEGQAPAGSGTGPSLTDRLRWIEMAFVGQLSKSASEKSAQMGFNAVHVLMQDRIGHLPDPTGREYRDHQFAPAIIPYCSAIQEFNLRLVETIVKATSS